MFSGTTEGRDFSRAAAALGIAVTVSLSLIHICFSGMTWGNVAAAALVVLPCLAAAFLLAKPMAAYQMGEQLSLIHI